MVSIASTPGYPGCKLLALPLRHWRFSRAERTSTSLPRGYPIVEVMLAITLFPHCLFCPIRTSILLTGSLLSPPVQFIGGGPTIHPFQVCKQTAPYISRMRVLLVQGHTRHARGAPHSRQVKKSRAAVGNKAMASIASTRGYPGGKLLVPPLLARCFGRVERTSTSLPRWCPIVEVMLAITLSPPSPLLPDSHLNPAHRLSSFPTSLFRPFSPVKYS